MRMTIYEQGSFADTTIIARESTDSLEALKLRREEVVGAHLLLDELVQMGEHFLHLHT